MSILFLVTVHWLSQKPCLSWEAFVYFPYDCRDSSSVFSGRNLNFCAVTKQHLMLCAYIVTIYEACVEDSQLMF